MNSVLTITEGTNSVNTAHRVMVLILCTSFNHGLYLYQSS